MSSTTWNSAPLEVQDHLILFWGYIFIFQIQDLMRLTEKAVRLYLSWIDFWMLPVTN